jgi:hypothetical protein
MCFFLLPKVLLTCYAKSVMYNVTQTQKEMAVKCYVSLGYLNRVIATILKEKLRTMCHVHRQELDNCIR